MYGSKGGNAWKSLPILTEGRRFESCHSEKHMVKHFLWTRFVFSKTNSLYSVFVFPLYKKKAELFAFLSNLLLIGTRQMRSYKRKTGVVVRVGWLIAQSFKNLYLCASPIQISYFKALKTCDVKL